MDHQLPCLKSAVAYRALSLILSHMKIKRLPYYSYSNKRSCKEVESQKLSNSKFYRRSHFKCLYKRYLCGCKSSLYRRLWQKTFSMSRLLHSKSIIDSSQHRRLRMTPLQSMLKSWLRKKRAKRTIVSVSIPKDTTIAPVKHLNNSKSMRSRCRHPRN